MEHRNRLSFQHCLVFVLLAFAAFSTLAASESASESTLDSALQAASLESLIAAAIENDPWMAQSRARERASRADAIAGGELPDPRISASFANFPTDTFDFSQEPMTQVMVGIMQSFPAGDTRQLKSQRFEQMGDISPIEQAMRAAQLTRDITMLWIDAALADETIRLIEQDRGLFDQLEAVTRSSYGAGGSGSSQQAVIRAELEVTRLNERLLRLKETRQRKIEQMAQWVPRDLISGITEFSHPRSYTLMGYQLPQHPEVRIHDQAIEIARTDYQLAGESKRPGIAVSTSYGYRDEDRNGRDLPDFVSVGVSMDLPLFTRNRQDKQITAAAERVAAAESARLLTIRKLESQKWDAEQRLSQLNQQVELYDDTLLKQMATLAGATLNAYSADQTDFAEVMRAHIAQLNARIEALRLHAERQKTQTQLQYIAAGVPATGASS